MVTRFLRNIRREYRVQRYRRRGAYIGPGVRLNGRIDGVNPHLVWIGDHTVVGRGTQIITHCPISPGPVRIGHHVFIGYGCIILPNVTIGDASIIGAGSVVTRDIPPLTVAAGNPARVIRRRSMAELVATIEALEEGRPIGHLPSCRFHGRCGLYGVENSVCNSAAEAYHLCGEYRRLMENSHEAITA